MDTPDWVIEGARVADWGGYGFSRSVSITTVVRLTATQIVCANGKRYRRDTLRGLGDSYRSELLPLTDPQVVNDLGRQRLSSLRHEIDRLCAGVGRGVESVLVVLDQIEQAVAAARKAISSPGEQE